MGLDDIRAEIEHMRVQIKRQQKDILSLQPAGISTASAVALLERMYAKVDGLIGERSRLVGEARLDKQPMPAAKPSGVSLTIAGRDVRASPVYAPWVIEEGEGNDQCFRVKDANGMMVCVILHREDLHARNYQYANESLSRDEAGRIAKGISRLPELMKRPPY
jgi:hypothetical protein